MGFNSVLSAGSDFLSLTCSALPRGPTRHPGRQTWSRGVQSSSPDFCSVGGTSRIPVTRVLPTDFCEEGPRGLQTRGGGNQSRRSRQGHAGEHERSAVVLLDATPPESCGKGSGKASDGVDEGPLGPCRLLSTASAAFGHRVQRCRWYTGGARGHPTEAEREAEPATQLPLAERGPEARQRSLPRGSLPVGQCPKHSAGSD